MVAVGAVVGTSTALVLAELVSYALRVCPRLGAAKVALTGAEVEEC